MRLSKKLAGDISRQKKLEGKRTLLRPLERSDLQRSLLWLTDPIVNKYLSQNFKGLTEEQEEKWFSYIQDSETDIVFAILEKDSSSHIGNCGLNKIDHKNGKCELGIVIGDNDYRNKGFGSDAVGTLINFAVEDLDIPIVRLNVYIYNQRAIKVYKKCGFKLIKVLKKDHLYDGKYWDTLIMEYNSRLVQDDP
jgi:RimJ/RimL family protein N-acetyltransferase